MPGSTHHTICNTDSLAATQATKTLPHHTHLLSCAAITAAAGHLAIAIACSSFAVPVAIAAAAAAASWCAVLKVLGAEFSSMLRQFGRAASYTQHVSGLQCCCKGLIMRDGYNGTSEVL
jgi:hypothetical protein